MQGDLRHIEKPPSASLLETLSPVLELDEVEKSFPGRTKPVLTHLSVSIPEGQFATIVGCFGYFSRGWDARAPRIQALLP